MSDSERTTGLHTSLIFDPQAAMQLLKVNVQKDETKGFVITLWGRDDAGHVLVTSVGAPSAEAIPAIVLSATKSLSVVASEVTEEESYKGSKAK